MTTTCECARPHHPTTTDRLQCTTCHRPTPHGPLPNPTALHNDAEEAAYLLGRLATEYRWAHDLTHDPTRHPAAGASRHTNSDPTGAIITDEHRQTTRALTIVAARRLDNAILELRAAFAAVGEAIKVQDRTGSADHVKAAYHDTFVPVIYQAQADAQARRHARGEL